MNYVLLTLSWIIFYTLHSILAASKLKRILQGKWGKAYKWYRLAYTLISVVLFIGIMIQALFIEKTIVIPKSDLTDYLAYMFAGFGTIIATKSIKNYSLKRFLGLDPSSKETETLDTTGLYSKVRHPLYAGLVLIFLGYFLFSGTVASAVHFGCLLLYLPFGTYFEEKKLVVQFGEAYQKYKSEVPSIIPKLW
ncbi:isoprenylcysteine carboxylmethyltransferase family protein [Algoriphagus sp. D3-2-R+10]|uniref:methyltransferase family protein n=1 Tax=Algoriphagus aurantiacus TaxID=3103948 RepID=UPI002B3D6EDA|nr:isoprenylcysteine carboxylmethyltransferase family protein [Algoriphagus sp. D3-2-R+10]MEB2773921.1 isoprenylcysteine carboxylmethyltransferase family protein [Algoriphagus sp. D3-2-R+10]